MVRLSYLKKYWILILVILSATIILATDWATEDETDFDLGAYNETEYNTTISAVTLTFNDTKQELINDVGRDGWVDMAGNIILFHLNNDTDYDETNSKVYDFSGNNHNGSIGGGGMVPNPIGLLHGGLEWKGSIDEFISIPHSDDWAFGSGDFTIEAWIYRAAGQFGAIYYDYTDYDSGAEDWFSIYVDTNNKLIAYRTVDGAGTDYIATATGTVPGSEWVHVAASKISGTLKLYINGVEKASGSSGTLANHARPLYIGLWCHAGACAVANRYIGKMDEHAVYTRGLSATEILNHYNRQKGKHIDRGEYISEVLDATFIAEWNNISWFSEVCYQCELPDAQATETGDYVRGANMTGNILLYHFNNDSTYGESDAYVYDFSGNGHNGTGYEFDGDEMISDGKFNGAVEFGGVDDFFNATDDDDWNFAGDDFTISLWGKFNNVGSTHSFVNQWPSGNTAWLLIFYGSQNKIYFYYSTDGSNAISKSVDWSPATDIWYHITVTRSGNNLYFFVDGIQIGATQDVSGVTIFNSGGALNIGINGLGNGFYLNGTIDEFAFYNRSLLPEEILNNYKRGALKLNLSVRSCDDDACSGESFIDVNDVSPQDLSVKDRQYFQYKFRFENEGTNYTSKLYNVTTYYVLDVDWVTEDESDFDEGAYNKTRYNTTISAVTLIYNDTKQELLNDMGSDGWGINMTGNVALLHMNNDSAYVEYNTHFYDFSGNGNNATGWNFDGDETIAGRLNNFIKFVPTGGSSDFISFGDPADGSLDAFTQMTVEAWVNFAGLNYQTIFSSGDVDPAQAGTAYSLWTDAAGGDLRFYINDDTTNGNINRQASGAVSVAGGWYHIVGTWNGTPTHASIKIYVNGVQVDDTTVAETGGFVALRDSSESKRIGLGAIGTSLYYTSLEIDEVAIYNRSLSATEILNHYSRQKGKHINRGEYTSKVFDSIFTSTWNNISWFTEVCYQCELPDDQMNETGDYLRGAEMHRNTLLFHLNNESDYLETNTHVYDFSGSGTNGTAKGTGEPLWTSDGKFGGAFVFDGTDDYISMGTAGTLNFGSASASMGAWVNTSASTFGYIISKMNTGVDAKYWYLAVNAAGKAVFRISDVSANDPLVTSTTSVNDGNWHYIMGVRDQPNDKLRIYVDGVEDATPVTDTVTGSQTNSHTAYISRGQGGGYFNGTIDEINFYQSRVLTATEILDQYKRGALELNLTVRSCDDDACSGEAYAGPYTVNPVILNTTVTPDNRYFQYKFRFEDSGHSNETFTPELYNVTTYYTISVVDTCTCPSPVADWDVDCTDDCVITATCYITDNILNLYGTGTFTVDAEIVAGEYLQDLNCEVIDKSGDGKTIWVEL